VAEFILFNRGLKITIALLMGLSMTGKEQKKIFREGDEER